ncbi:MAG: hypothetical protein HQL07_07610 [Nitrospirae bacterium]|nr:hypothetical protein [Magnetococcales bacterium]HAT50403.1 hypothetical protein [Alphaproteobacteria bacterium]
MWKFSYINLAVQQQHHVGERDTRSLDINVKSSTGHSTKELQTGGTNTAPHGSSMGCVDTGDNAGLNGTAPKYNRLQVDPETKQTRFVE